MKKSRFPYLIMAALSVMIIVYSFWRCTSDNMNYKIVSITGSTHSHNVTRSHFYFGTMPYEGDTTALMVSEGDLLYNFCESENALILMYRNSDGNHLEISTDTSRFYRIDLNGKLHTLAFLDEDDISDWMENKDLEAVEDLRAIQISGPAIFDYFEILEEIAGINRSPGLFFEDVNDPGYFQKILSLFNPPWLFLIDIDANMLTGDLIDNLANVKALVFSSESSQDYSILYKLPNLQSLIIENWNPEDPDPFDVTKVPNLKSLCLVNAELVSVSDLGSLPGLRHLALIDCDTLTDISALSGFGQLKELSLMSCDDLEDISILGEIPGLQFLSFPPSTTQQQFADIIEHQPELRAVELVECDELTDLSALASLEDLISVSASMDKIDYGSLEKLTSAGLIVLDPDEFEDSVPGLQALRTALPDAYIVPGAGFCMGSGWILLLLPLILGAVAIRRMIRR